MAKEEPGVRTYVLYYPDETELKRIARYGAATLYADVRGSTSSRSDFLRRSGTVIVGPVLYRLAYAPLERILLELAAAGVYPDFMETYHEGERWSTVTTSFVDMRRKTPEFAAGIAAFPRYYPVRTGRGGMPFAVIDRERQRLDIDVLAGRYEAKAAVAKFALRRHAEAFAGLLNGKAAP